MREFKLPYMVVDRGNLVGRYSTIGKAMLSAQKLMATAQLPYNKKIKVLWGKPKNILIYKGIAWKYDGILSKDAIVTSYDENGHIKLHVDVEAVGFSS